MKAKSLIVLLLAGIWGVGSWWWYTCKVKGFCGTDNTTSAQIAEGTPVTGADINTSTNPIDTDGDGIPDTKEAMLGLDPTKEDSDGDGISDFIELARDPQDTDGDGKIDAIDDDDDNDGILTSAENPDPNGDGNVDDALDSNNNQLADYLDPSTTPSTTDTADADKAKAEAEKADADKAKAEAEAEKADADKAKAEAEKADADKAKAEAEKADADKAKAEAEKADADKAKAEAEKADADKAKAEAEKADADKVTLETDNATQGSDIGPATLTFPTGSANPKLAATTQAYFDKLAAFLKDNSSAKVTIVGHTDSQGDAAKNKVLGLQRAEMLQKILIDIGAPKNRVTASSQGADKPIADNKTEEGRKKNRRVEITPIK
ncbi:OmpA family protein [Thiothrix lacustris]|uniref:OmpA family protein n=1 Tax=Thiothrix lacustris TaxID=525917 RepID=A0ABY9MRS7_9GAMM|nr:OmpA family protein [Thiothrix lacustris]WML91302.1 OmpA family protein [Thiothrix lacustris]